MENRAECTARIQAEFLNKVLRGEVCQRGALNAAVRRYKRNRKYDKLKIYSVKNFLLKSQIKRLRHNLAFRKSGNLKPYKASKYQW